MEKQKQKLITVSFDGVLHHNAGRWPICANHVPGASAFLEELAHRGYEVEVSTVREPAHVLRWLREHDMAQHVCDVTSQRSPHAIAYVDDRAVRFDGNFCDVLDALEKDVWWAYLRSEQ